MTTSPLLTPVTTAQLPTPVGPYSPGVIVGNLVFVSGQAGRDPQTGQLADDVEAQTEQTLRNVAAILEAAGSSLSQVIRCGVFLVDMTEFQKMNAVYARMFGDHRPARTTVEVSGLPGAGLRVEIDAVAVVGRGEMRGGRRESYGENGFNTKHRSERRRNEENWVSPPAVYEHRSRRRPVGPASRIESAPEIESTVHLSGALDLRCALDTARANARRDRWQEGGI